MPRVYRPGAASEKSQLESLWEQSSPERQFLLEPSVYRNHVWLLDASEEFLNALSVKSLEYIVQMNPPLGNRPVADKIALLRDMMAASTESKQIQMLSNNEPKGIIEILDNLNAQRRKLFK